MAQIGISVTEKILEPLKELGEKRNIAIMRACNRSAAWARTRHLQRIPQALNVSRDAIDARKHRDGAVAVKNASTSRLEAHVHTTGRRIRLYRFNGKAITPPATGVPVSFQIRPGNGKVFTNNAFGVRFKNGHEGYFRRGGAGRSRRIVAMTGKRAGKKISSEGGLREYFGPSVPRVAEKDPDMKRLFTVDSAQRFEVEMQRQVNFILTGNANKSLSDGVQDLGGGSS